MTAIAILPHYKVASYDGGDLPPREQWAEVKGLSEFFAPHLTDAMALPYLCGDASSFPRLRDGGARQLPDTPTLQYLVLDIDPIHKRGTPSPDSSVWRLRKEGRPEAGKLEWVDRGLSGGYLNWALGLLDPDTQSTMLCAFTTQKGLRFIWSIDGVLPVWQANSFVRQFACEKVAPAIEQVPHLKVDESSWQWQRMMRLPRATRYATSGPLDPFIKRVEGPGLDPTVFGYALTTQAATPTPSVAAPLDPEEVDWDDLKHAYDMDWVLKGQPVPENDEGSRYNMARTAVARIIARGKYEDPHIPYSILFDSVDATVGSSLDLSELWDLCESICAKQTEANASAADSEDDLPDEDPLTNDEWRIVRKAMKGKARDYYSRMRQGDKLSANSSHYETVTMAQATRLLQAGLLPDRAFNALRPSVMEQKKPTLQKVWDTLTVEYREMSEDDTTAIQRAFTSKYPLLVSTPDGQLFQLDTTSHPFRYRMVHKDQLDMVYSQYTSRKLPFEPTFYDVPVRKLLAWYGAPANSVEYVAGARSVSFMGDKVLMGCHAVDTGIDPVYHGDVDAWLNLIGESDVGGLLDWLACLTYSAEQPLAALYLEGGTGHGKTMLALGIARLWNTPFLDYNQVMSSSFNGQLTQSPFLVADEGVQVGRFEEGASQKFRSAVANTTHYLNPKNKQPIPLTGALRIYINANDGFGLPFRESLGRHGIEAVVQRVLYIKTAEASGAYLRAIGGRAATLSWVPSLKSPGKIAEHLMWLRVHRKVTPPDGARFLVSGKETEWHRKFAANQGIKPGVLQTAWSVMQMVAAGGAVGDEVYLRDDPEQQVVYIHPDVLKRYWTKFSGSRPTPPQDITTAALQIATGRERIYFGERRRRCLIFPYSAFVDANVCELDDLLDN